MLIVPFLLGCSWSSRPPPTLTPVVADALATQDMASLSKIVAQLSDPALDGRDEGTEGSAAARTLLVEQLTACGVDPAGEAGFLQEIGTGRGTNVLGRIRGTAGTDHVLVVGAHYDHQGGGWSVHPGAQDNAASVGIALHVACALAAAPPAGDVLVAFWDAEEPPTFLTESMGSRYWYANPTIDRDDIGASVTMDLLGGGLWDGYLGSFALGAEHSPALRQALYSTDPGPGLAVHDASLSVVEDLVIGRHMVWSDYEVFRRHEKPVLFLTDGQNRRYHTADDTFEALDLFKLAAEAGWVHRLVRRIADGPRPTWDPSADPANDLEAVRKILDDALATKATAAWGETALAALTEARRGLTDNASPFTVRAAAQRLMCWAGPRASSITCGML